MTRQDEPTGFIWFMYPIFKRFLTAELISGFVILLPSVCKNLISSCLVISFDLESFSRIFVSISDSNHITNLSLIIFAWFLPLRFSTIFRAKSMAAPAAWPVIMLPSCTTFADLGFGISFSMPG